MQKPHFYEITEDRAGQRIDNFLLAYLKGVPKSRIYRVLRKGEVRVNKGRVKPSYRLQKGDSVRIPPIRYTAEAHAGTPSVNLLQRIENCVIYEDEQLMILDKPSGMAVHGGSGLSFGAIELLRAARPQARSLELVHRLDRDTSGCLVVAKKRSVLRRLHELFRSGEVQKRYLALVKGRWRGAQQKVNAPLQKNVLRSGERMVQVHPDGKEAVSIFTPVKVFSNASLMSVELITGRTHQIRVHSAHIGHPIAGDEKYGDNDFNQWAKTMGLKRLFLHAESLKFTLPDRERPIEVKAPLGADLLRVLDNLAVNGSNEKTV
jgi:23S rRNA pseudouridine955/2504/2580 synthase